MAKKAAAAAKKADKQAAEAAKKAQAQAAAIFDEMMAGDLDTVVKILKNMASNKRGAIIENMTTLSTAQVTKLME